MHLKERIESFSELGETLRNALAVRSGKVSEDLNNLSDFLFHCNEWFTPENVRMAVSNIAVELTSGNLIKWCSHYPELLNYHKPINVGVVMAGNIPLAGFHDFLSVLISGNNIIAKTSSKDNQLIVFISDLLTSINPEFKKRISITGNTITGFDAVIATGSDNSSRYFEYYFRNYPHIIRKNRNSIAILEGDETGKELEALGLDVFSYFGLGCRNISKIYLPAGYKPGKMAEQWTGYSGVVNNRKYANNYDFNKAVFLVNKEKFFDTGSILIKEDPDLETPVAVLHYEYYETERDVMEKTQRLKDKIQCITGRKFIPFGKAQSPQLWDYADGFDTIDFLLKKNIAGIL